MRFEWDDAKAAANLARHGVAFEAARDFDWDTALEAEDLRADYGERRVIALGRLRGRLHVLIYTRRGEDLRIISLRRANDREARRYEQG